MERHVGKPELSEEYDRKLTEHNAIEVASKAMAKQ